MTSTHQGTIIIALLGLIAGSCLGMVTMIGANVAHIVKVLDALAK